MKEKLEQNKAWETLNKPQGIVLVVPRWASFWNTRQMGHWKSTRGDW